MVIYRIECKQFLVNYIYIFETIRDEKHENVDRGLFVKL